MRFHLLMILAIAVTFGPRANADSTFGYSLGVSLQNTVVPGSMISINAFLLNTGSTPIVFAPSFPGGPPSAEGGSLPFGLSYNCCCTGTPADRFGTESR